MAGQRTPNTLLAQLIAETGVSNSGLAHRVADAARARGLNPPRYNHSSVARWLAGQHPQGDVPDLIAEVFTGLLGRKVTRADAGMPEARRRDVTLDYPPGITDATDAAASLYAADSKRPDAFTKSGFAAAAYFVPVLRWMTAPHADLADRHGSVHVGSEQVEAIRQVTATFRHLDNQLGGGYARTTVVQYLADEVAPMLRTGSYTAGVGRDLFEAAAEMSLLVGWMAYDLEQHATTQRYLIQALRLAQAAGSVVLGGEILGAIAAQAAYLGDGSGAVDVARAAARAARRAGSGALLAEALSAEAHGHALAGDVRRCGILLAEAHQSLDTSRDEPAFLAYFDGAYLSAKTGRALLDAGDPAGAVKALRASLQMRPGFQRGRVFNLSMLASALTEAREIEEACTVAIEAAAGARPIASSRVENELGLLARRLAPHASAPGVSSALGALPTGRRSTRALPAGR